MVSVDIFFFFFLFTYDCCVCREKEGKLCFLVQKNTVDKVHKYITPKIERIFIKTKGVLKFRGDWLKSVWFKKNMFLQNKHVS